MTSQTDRKRQAEIAAAGADSVMMGGNRWQPALSLQDRYSTTRDLKGSSRKLERWEYREIHRAWSGFYFSGCLLFLVYSYSSSSQPEYFTSSFRSVTFFYGLPWKICQAAHGSVKWQKPTRKHKGHVFMPLNCLARCYTVIWLPQPLLKRWHWQGHRGPRSWRQSQYWFIMTSKQLAEVPWHTNCSWNLFQPCEIPRDWRHADIVVISLACVVLPPVEGGSWELSTSTHAKSLFHLNSPRDPFSIMPLYS